MPGPIPRPVNGLRGYQSRWATKAGGALGVAAFSGMMFYYLTFQRPRTQAFEHFYATADPYKMLEKICEKNAFSSCPKNLANK